MKLKIFKFDRSELQNAIIFEFGNLNFAAQVPVDKDDFIELDKPFEMVNYRRHYNLICWIVSIVINSYDSLHNKCFKRKL